MVVEQDNIPQLNSQPSNCPIELPNLGPMWVEISNEPGRLFGTRAQYEKIRVEYDMARGGFRPCQTRHGILDHVGL
ncbi:hypothetical protein PanWU01x14_207340 [Parasponia andersonii]|uniref:Uncharacterized protein n=1 Tax=Parasponia andersonii TaxID=3476 RepID=A0A2P5BV09_PARAD|nr:hypothetical protein PanWU01x14_207340 [Parasponia andersonii]